MVHRNACLSERGRLMLAKVVVEDGWSYARASERFNTSKTTAQRWAWRYRHVTQTEGRQPTVEDMADRSSRPHHSPRRTPQHRERRILGLRTSRQWGPARIAYHLNLHPSTVGKVLCRYQAPPLSWIDPMTGVNLRASKRKARRYEKARPGELVHMDIKKLGRIPDGGGWRAHGRRKGRRRKKQAKPGYSYLHHVIDDHSRLVYSEELPDEKKTTVVEFWRRAVAWFKQHGITIQAVMTDNGGAYRSKLFAKVLEGQKIKHKRTRPYRPQTNGKVERFNKTLMAEWAYAQPYTSNEERTAAYKGFLHRYNHHRGHTSLKGQPPASRVPNLCGSHI